MKKPTKPTAKNNLIYFISTLENDLNIFSSVQGTGKKFIFSPILKKNNLFLFCNDYDILNKSIGLKIHKKDDN